MDWIRKSVLPLLLLLAVVAGPRPAAAADATLYEMIESMSIVKQDGRDRRQAWAALDGTARPGTLLCPLQATCTLVGWGWSDVEILTGKGTFSGSFTVVVDGDNAVDGPEAKVFSGRFSGTMDFSPALLAGQPYGTIVGTVTVYKGVDKTSAPLKGTFLLPFVLPGDSSNTPYYLGLVGLQPDGSIVPVKDSERALTRPTVKLEICVGSGGC
jgi:hypothetical protein